MPQYELNLRDYWQIIQRRRVVFIIVFFVVLILTMAYTQTQKPIYQASAAVQFLERKTLGSLLTEIVVENVGDPLATQARIITSLPVLEKVVVELKLVNKDASATEIMDMAMALQGAVSTDIITDTSIIQIGVNHDSPQMAADIANKVAEVYVAENLRQKTKESRTVREFIEKQLEEVTVKLKSSEEALAKFKEIETPSGIALSFENRLADLELRHQELLKQYTQRHPDVINIEEEISLVKKRLRILPQKELEYGRLNRDVEVNTKLYHELQDKLASARITEAEKVEDVTLVDYATAPASPISPNRGLNYLVGIIIGLMLGFTSTSIVEQLDTSIGTIEDVEGFLKLPALGVIPYLKTQGEKKEGLIRRLWPIEIKNEEKISHLRKQLILHYSTSSPIFEAYRILRTNIQKEVFKEELKGKIILLSSSGPEEGKSITISNLAITMAQGNLRVLLIDADMRRSTIHKIFGLKHRAPGLCDVLRGTIKPEGAIRTFTDILMGEVGFDEALKVPGLDGLSILTSGSLPTIPAELLSSAEMNTLLEKLKENFDLILIDTPPVLAVADAIILASKADAVILVYRVGKTARLVLDRTKTQLVEAGAQVKGVILNNISPEVEMRYGYHYHYKYYGKYYGEKKEEA